MTRERIFSGGQAHGLREDNKHRTESGVQVETHKSQKTLTRSTIVVINHIIQPKYFSPHFFQQKTMK